MTDRRTVLISGLGAATSLGLSVEESWRRALAGESGVRRLEAREWRSSPVQAAGALKAGDWERIAARYDGETDTSTLLALWAAGSALADAGLSAGGARIGVVLGAGISPVHLQDTADSLGADGDFDAARLAAGLDEMSPDSALRKPSDRLAGVVAERFGLGGVNRTITSACAAASQAIGQAFRMVRRGELDVVVAGGADSMLHAVGLIFFPLLGAAATGAGAPESLCRPFDMRRKGLVMGEGAGVVVLESSSHAAARGARGYAELAGYGSSQDGHRPTAPDPDGRGAARAMAAALADAGAEPAEVDYVNAHGTGTRLNDSAEAAAIQAVFGDHAACLAISSSKSLIGHLVAACGGPELVFTTLSVHRDEIHPTRNLSRPDPGCGLDFTAGGARATRVRCALSNSFGFGGQNASLVVRKLKRQRRRP